MVVIVWGMEYEYTSFQDLKFTLVGLFVLCVPIGVVISALYFLCAFFQGLF